MRVCILIVGAIRNDFDLICENIEHIKRVFSFAEMYVIMCTWEPTKMIYGNQYIANYYYNYSKDDLISKISPHIDKLIFMENLNLSTTVKLHNGMPPVALYQLHYLQKFLNNSELTFDYIIKTRNDLKITIKSPSNFLDSNTYIPPVYWRPHELYQPINDHFFIMPSIKFSNLNLSIEYIQHLTTLSWDNEALNNRLITPDKIIPKEMIELYKLDGGCKLCIT